MNSHISNVPVYEDAFASCILPYTVKIDILEQIKKYLFKYLLSKWYLPIVFTYLC